VICALVATTSGAASRKKYAAAPAPTAVASRIVSRLTLDALAVCARVRRVAGIVFFDEVTGAVFSAARAFPGASLRTDDVRVILTGVRCVIVCRARRGLAKAPLKAPAC